MGEGKQFWYFVQKLDEVFFSVDNDLFKDIFVDKSIQKLKVFESESDYFSIIFKVEEHIVDELDKERLDIDVFVVEIVMNIDFELFKGTVGVFFRLEFND